MDTYPEYHAIQDLQELIPETPADAIVSRTLHKGDKLNVTLFSFSAGQELTEHTASRPAILHFLDGHARLTLGADEHDVKAGAWIYMAPHLPHSIFAETDVVMLLELLA